MVMSAVGTPWSGGGAYGSGWIKRGEAQTKVTLLGPKGIFNEGLFKPFWRLLGQYVGVHLGSSSTFTGSPGGCFGPRGAKRRALFRRIPTHS